MTWIPADVDISGSNITSAMTELGLPDFNSLYQWSIRERAAFWKFTIERLGIRFAKSPTQILDTSHGPANPDWLSGARMNIVESCWQSDSQDHAIVFDGTDSGPGVISYGELQSLTHRVANGLRNCGLQPGDSVAVFMPMTAESVAIYLGIITAGCVVVSIADSFSADQLGVRLRVGNARLVFTVRSVNRGGKQIPIYDRVVDAAAPPAVLLDEDSREDGGLRSEDVTWKEWLVEDDSDQTVHMTPESAINVLFSSGTTGDPKAIPWDHTTPIKAAADGHYHHDIHPGDVVAWPTNLGWMMGPWLVMAALINRGTIALFHGSPLDRTFGQFVQQVGVNMLGVVPSLVRHWRQSGCMAELDWSAIRAFSSTGECSNADDMQFLSDLAGNKPIIEYCGGTEIGGGYITSSVVQPNEPGLFSTPALGSELVILDEQNCEASIGELFLVPPAMGLSRNLLGRDHDEVYYEGSPAGPRGEVLRRHGDQFESLGNGFFRALGRADDTMNLGGIKVGAAEIERVVSIVDGVKEVAAIAVAPAGGGPSRLVLCVAMESGKTADSKQIQEQMQQKIKQNLNPLFKIDDVFVLQALPRTASNKVIRRQLRSSYEANS